MNWQRIKCVVFGHKFEPYLDRNFGMLSGSKCARCEKRIAASGQSTKPATQAVEDDNAALIQAIEALTKELIRQRHDMADTAMAARFTACLLDSVVGHAPSRPIPHIPQPSPGR